MVIYRCVVLNTPTMKVKFLAAEALRGVGGVLIDRDGKRSGAIHSQ